MGTGKEQFHPHHRVPGCPTPTSSAGQGGRGPRDEDKKKQKLIEIRNQADTLIYTTEKSIRDLGDKLDAATRADIEAKVEALKGVMDSGDAEAIEKATGELAQASHKLAEKLYQQQSQPGAEQPGGPAQQAGRKKDDDDVVDADYKEV